MKPKKWPIFLIILILSLFLRFFLAPKAFHVDLLSQAEWGQRIFAFSPKNFYQSQVWTYSWPNHPPLTSLHYSLCQKIYRHLSLRLHQSLFFSSKHHLFLPSFYQNFVHSFDTLVSPEQPFPLGFLITLKILPISGDILISILIFYLTKSYIYSTIYLFSPFSFYISSLWGQTDQIAAFFTILSFILLPKNPSISLISFYLGASLKPTSLLLVPLYLYLLIKIRPNLSKIILSLFSCFLLTLLIFHPFQNSQNIFHFAFNTLLPRLADRPDRLTTNAYNFWHIFTLNQAFTPTLLEKVLSFLFYLLINLFAFKHVKIINTRNIISSLFIVSFGSWLFLTNMLDRYSFIGILASLILVYYYPPTLKYWLPLSLIYWLNLFRGWWYPFPFLQHFLSARNYLAGLPLSLLNCFCFFQIIRETKKSS